MIRFSRSSLRLALWSYGEDDLYPVALKATDAQLDRIGQLAQEWCFIGPRRPDGSSMLIDKAVALGAVEVLTGSRRDLKRARRRPARDYILNPAEGEDTRRVIL